MSLLNTGGEPSFFSKLPDFIFKYQNTVVVKQNEKTNHSKPSAVNLKLLEFPIMVKNGLEPA